MEGVVVARRLEMFPGDTRTNSEVIWAHTLNFGPNFKFSPLKFLGDRQSLLLVMCASKPWSISNACKNLRDMDI